MKKALVIGLKRSGTAASLLLLKHGYEVFVTDLEKQEIDSTLLKYDSQIHFYFESHPNELLQEKYDIVVKNPGIPYSVPFIQDIVKTNEIITEIELAYRFSEFEHEYIAVTGTNGKTTTVTLIHEMLKTTYDNCVLCGNIGIPLSQVVYEATRPLKVVLELSNFQLMGMPTFHPRFCAILNLSPDHLDYMPSLDAYYQSKMLIYKNQTEHDYLVLNSDDSTLLEYAQNYKSQLLTFSLFDDNSTCYYKDLQIHYLGKPVINVKDMLIKGQHNYQNAMAAIIFASKLNVSIDNIKNVLKSFSGVKYRLAYIGKFDNKEYYNDSKSTSPQSTITALKAITKPHYLILGGKDKGLDYSVLKPYLSNTVAILAYGENRNQLSEIFENVVVFEELSELIAYVKDQCNEYSVLFSPGTSSYDQFENFERRGDYFEKIVRKDFV